MSRASWLSLRPAGAPEASLSVAARLGLPLGSASLGQSAAWAALPGHPGLVLYAERCCATPPGGMTLSSTLCSCWPLASSSSVYELVRCIGSSYSPRASPRAWAAPRKNRQNFWGRNGAPRRKSPGVNSANLYSSRVRPLLNSVRMSEAGKSRRSRNRSFRLGWHTSAVPASAGWQHRDPNPADGARCPARWSAPRRRR